MAVYTVTTGAADDETDALSFGEALALAAANAGEDTIKFAPDVQFVFKNPDPLDIETSVSFGIGAAGGPVIIDGDHDGDGVADVIFRPGAGPHIVVEAGAIVEIRSVDFVGGFDAKHNAAARGEDGTEGENASLAGHDGYDSSDGLDDATAGGAGGRGEDGSDSVGSIHNFGDLTLVRVGFGLNKAVGEPGGRGGTGGGGGDAGTLSGIASDDLPETDDAPPAEYTGEHENIHVEETNPRSSPVSGDGGEGGIGASGGLGGEGGDSGDAGGAILNEAGAVLRLQDVVFGGRLSSGFVSAGNEAAGGTAGRGGNGGTGGNSYGGGGADSVSDWVVRTSASRAESAENRYERVFIEFDSSEAGTGGDGGTGGSGGDGGAGGVAGDAGTIFNRGTLSGKAAFSENPQTGNTVEAGQQNSGSGGGLGGNSYGGPGGEQRIDWAEWTGEGIFNSVVIDGPGFEDWIAGFDYVRSWPGPRQLLTGTTADDGADGQAGARGTNGNNGVAGNFDARIFDEGASTAETGNALVYLVGGGEVTEGGKIAFTIVRVGDVSGSASVAWRIVGEGVSGVTEGDFGASEQLSGIVQLGALTYTEPESWSEVVYDRTNVQRIEIDVLADGVAEGAEGWKVEIVSASGGDVLVGTSEITGTIADGGVAEEPNEISGNRKGNKLNGTGQDDEILGKGGNDRLFGKNGDDTLKGGSGEDTLIGGGGEDTLIGGGGKDLLKGGADDDILLGRGGKDTLRGGGGEDTLNGGGGKDRLFGDADGDLLIGGAGNDLMWGRGGADIFQLSERKNGRDQIKDFAAGIVLLFFTGDVTFDDLSLSNTRKGLKVDWDGGTAILKGVKRGHVDEDDFFFG